MKTKKARAEQKGEQAKSRQVNASGQVNYRESTADAPLNERLVTDKPLQYSTLRGKVQNRCKETQFQPGQSGNPNGRPRSADLKAAVREFADEVDPKRKKSRLRAWMETADRLARQGSSKHLELLLAYGWHRPLQQQLNVTADLASDEESTREIREAVAAIRAERGDYDKLPVI